MVSIFEELLIRLSATHQDWFSIGRKWVNYLEHMLPRKLRDSDTAKREPEIEFW